MQPQHNEENNRTDDQSPEFDHHRGRLRFHPCTTTGIDQWHFNQCPNSQGTKQDQCPAGSIRQQVTYRPDENTHQHGVANETLDDRFALRGTDEDE